MSYQELQLTLESEQAEKLSDALMEYGALSSAIEDAHAGTELEEPIFGEPGEPTATIWKQSLILALFPADADIDTILKNIAQELEINLPKYTITLLPEQDWVRLTQSQFDPIKISQRLWIVPSWHEFPDKNAINLKLDPGLAFGTGSHPTTRLCLQWLEQNIQGKESLLDYGCGSGILAIAAIKLGAQSAVGVDIDEQAILSSQENAANNQVQVSFYLPDDMPKDKTYDVVVANILSNPLRLIGGLLSKHTKKGGHIVLSGILQEQAEEIISLYQQWYTMEKPMIYEGWVCLTGIKK